MSKITGMRSYEMLDSRGNPTVAVQLELEDGSQGFALVPSGASTGAKEAVELRDADENRFHGKGVTRAASAVIEEIQPALLGRDADDQAVIDGIMIDLDGTENKGRLGANAILAVSVASARAAAQSHGVSLYRWLGGARATLLPMPMMNVINGGAHADNPLDFQEFMVAPIGAETFPDAVRMGSEIFHTLKKTLAAAGHNTNVGDEGGFAPNVATAEEALDVLTQSIEMSGYTPGSDVGIMLDPAASEFYRDGAYHYVGSGLVRSTEEHVAYLGELISRYPIVSIEDPVAEDDIDGWKMITRALGNRIQLVGDDVFCTNPKLLLEGIEGRYANSVLIKINQIGTLTETFEALELASKAGYTSVVSHRSGETEDTTVADLAVASGCGQIKTGSLSRSDRTSKYNRLLKIADELGSSARYEGTMWTWALSG